MSLAGSSCDWSCQGLVSGESVKESERWWLSGDVIELLIYHQPSVKLSLTLHPFGILGYVAGHSLTVVDK